MYFYNCETFKINLCTLAFQLVLADYIWELGRRETIFVLHLVTPRLGCNMWGLVQS